MTGKPSGDDPAKSAKMSGAGKASVHEAIGKLIGDDAERERGAADKEANESALGKATKPRSPK